MQVEVMAARCSGFLNDLLTAEIVKPGVPIDGKASNPFDYHLYSASRIPNNEKVDDAELWSQYLAPGVQNIANALKSFDMLSAEAVTCKLPLGIVCEAVATPVSGVPVRVIVEPGWHLSPRVIIEVKVRHTGNCFRRIINGPLHREMMPFKDKPAWDGYEFEYPYLPYRARDYTINGDWDSPTLPGLNPDAMFDASVHSYKVVGNYCYYLGEKLQR